MAGIEVVRQPANGVATASGVSGLSFQPKVGFKGRDTMTLRFLGNGGRKATVTFEIWVN
jgi:hypothetical protein